MLVWRLGAEGYRKFGRFFLAVSEDGGGGCFKVTGLSCNKPVTKYELEEGFALWGVFVFWLLGRDDLPRAAELNLVVVAEHVLRSYICDMRATASWV